MKSIGEDLRQARELLGLTLEDVERATRIRPRYLQAIEQGDLSALPSLVQARGFLRNYAEFLGLDSEDILLRYKEASGGRNDSGRLPGSLERPLDKPTIQIRGARPRWLSMDLFVAAFIVVAIVAVLIWGVTRLLQGMREGTQAALEPAQLVLVTPPSASPTTTPAGSLTLTPVVTRETEGVLEPTEFPTLEPFTGPLSGVNLRILVERRVFLRVSVDGEQEFSGRVAPGDILEFSGEDRIELLTGNAGGVRVLFNGEDQGLLGDLGEVLTRIWNTEGRITATPTATFTPTATLRPSGTPSPTP